MRAVPRIGDEHVESEQHQQEKREKMKQYEHVKDFIAKWFLRLSIIGT
jgi:hypothetical protein